MGASRSADRTGILLKSDRGIHHAKGDTVPSDGAKGYATGCRFDHTDGAAGTSSYRNVGTKASADFDAEDAASTILITDAGGFTTATTVEGALAELHQHTKSVQSQVNCPLGGAILAAGTPMAAWADNAASNPGITLANSEAVGLRWNNNGTQTAVWLPPIALPQDLDDTAAVVVHIAASKTGATVGDATTFTIAAFFQEIGALHDADSDCGGASSAMTGDATAKTVQEVTLTLAAGDVPAAPCVLSMSIKPTDGTLGTDDVIVHSVWLEYKKKFLTS